MCSFRSAYCKCTWIYTNAKNKNTCLLFAKLSSKHFDVRMCDENNELPATTKISEHNAWRSLVYRQALQNTAVVWITCLRSQLAWLSTEFQIVWPVYGHHLSDLETRVESLEDSLSLWCCQLHTVCGWQTQMANASCQFKKARLLDLTEL